MRAIVQLFSKSPFGPLQEHLKKVGDCVELVKPLFQALLDNDDESLRSTAKQISKLEHSADEIKNEIRDNLPRNIFMPVNRSDFLNLLSQQDSIADTVEDIAFLLTVRKTNCPESWRDSLLSYVHKCVNVFNETSEIYESLDSLVQSGMTGSEASAVLKKINDIGLKEWEVDKTQFEMLSNMFSMEDEMKPADLFWWSKIFKELGDIGNYSEKSVNSIRMMIYT
jgi:predicted phosphate transport protein (TIGR00153 family)|tara:strand:- start:8104 stop:8775 length:672 start_codon:yes stop_codon:yes gene_type:complete